MRYNHKFDQLTKNLIDIAFEEAKMMGHNYVGTEHLLIALCHEDIEDTQMAFSRQGINIEDVRLELIKTIGKGVFTIQAEGLTPRAKRCLDMACDISNNDYAPFVLPKHVLKAIIEDKHALGYKLMVSLNIDLDDLFSGNRTIPAKKVQMVQPVKQPENEGTPVTESVLKSFGINLVEMAKNNRLDPVIGRDKEISRLIQVLSRRTKNNPCLIGEPGVGKTVIVEGLAQRIQKGNVPETLKDKMLYSVSISALLGGTMYRGEFESRMNNLIKEVSENDKVMLFIDELHTIMGAGNTGGKSLDASNILKPALGSGNFQFISATTVEEYSKFVENDPAFERRLQSIMVEEPTREETVEMLHGIKTYYEEHHNVKITEQAIVSAVDLTIRYLSNRFLPDKAIDVIDEAASRKRLEIMSLNTELIQFSEQLSEIKKKKAMAVKNLEFEEADKLKSEEEHLIGKIEFERKQNEKKMSQKLLVQKTEIEGIISQWTGIPLEEVSIDEKARLLKLEESISKRIIGQKQAVSLVSRAIRRARVGLANPNRPIGNFIFLGPTGVGKTELSKALAECLFGDEKHLIRFDMSEYMEKHSVSKLIGAPPGYTGFEDGGFLTEKVKKQPYAILLFDEIEKAHSDVQNILLQILDEGRLTDGRGREVDFRNTIIILTSNLGVEQLKTRRSVGFATDTSPERQYEKNVEILMDEIKKHFRPEFINRIDEIIIFKNLTHEEINQVVTLNIKELKKRLCERSIEMTIDEAAIDFIADTGYDEEYGARPIKRVITKFVEDLIAEEILKGHIGEGDIIQLVYDQATDRITKKE